MTITPQTVVFGVFTTLAVPLTMLGFYTANKVSPQFRMPAKWLMAWIGLSCFNEAVNVFSWAGNLHFSSAAAGFCEFSIRLRMAACVGIPAALFAISLRVHAYISAVVADDPKAYENKILARRGVEFFIVFAFPPIYILAELLDSTRTDRFRRFAILEGVGCVNVPHNSAGSIILAYYSLIVVCLPVFAFGLVAFAHWFSHSKLLRTDLARNSRSFLIRLMLLAIVILPLSLASLFISALNVQTLDDLLFTAQSPVVTPRGITLISRDAWTSDSGLVLAIELGRWTQAGGPAIAIIVFYLLAFDGRSRRFYGFAGRCFARCQLSAIGTYQPIQEPRLPMSLRPPRPHRGRGRYGNGSSSATEMGCMTCVTGMCMGGGC